MAVLRRELFERVRRLKELADWPAFVLLVALGLTTWGVRLWTQHHPDAEVLNRVLEGIDKALFVLDLIGAGLFLAIKLSLLVGLLRPNRDVWRMIEDDELSRRIEDRLHLDLAGQPTRKVNFCSRQLIEHVCKLDLEAFEGTIYGVEEEELSDRYMAWFCQNPRIFALMMNPMELSQTIGYSAMVPVTEEGLHGYLAGDFKDRNTPPALVAKDRKHTAAVLLFAIALRKEYSFTKSQADRKYSLYFQDCILDHALGLFPKRDQEYPPIYAETEHPALKRRMLRKYGFVDSGRISADGYPIFFVPKPFCGSGSDALQPTLEVVTAERGVPQG